MSVEVVSHAIGTDRHRDAADGGCRGFNGVGLAIGKILQVELVAVAAVGVVENQVLVSHFQRDGVGVAVLAARVDAVEFLGSFGLPVFALRISLS